MNSTKSQTKKKVNPGLRRRKRRRAILRFIFKKLLLLALVRKYFRILLQYLLFAYAAAFIGFKAGSQGWEQTVSIVNQQTKEIIETQKKLEETQRLLGVKNHEINALQAYEKAFKELEKRHLLSLELTEQINQKWNTANIELVKDNKKIQNELVETKEKLKEIKDSFYRSEKNRNQIESQLNLEELRSKKDSEFLNQSLKNSHEKLSEVTKTLNKKINNLENLKKEFNHLKQNLENSQAEKANLTSQIKLLEQKFESYKADTEGKIDSLMKAKDKLELEIRLKEDQNHLKELRIKELQIQLEDQLKIQDEFVEIRSKLKALSSKVEDVETQKRLDWLLRAIDTFLNRKIKFF